MTAETIHTCSYECERPECIRAQRDELAARLTAAMSQPEASAPVGVEASYHPCTSVLIEGLKRLEGGSDVLAEWDRARAKADASLAQQPAAVDGAYPTPRNRAEAAALARLALAHLGVIDAHIDVAIARCETNSATQHQEPKS